MKKEDNRGFSLLELVITIAILAVLGGILIGITGNIGNYKLKQYTKVLDSFMKKTRTDAMAKKSICGICIYRKDDRFYVESYGEERTETGGVEYHAVETKELGKDAGIKIGISKKDGSREQFLKNNQKEDKDSYIRIKYATGTGAVANITIDSEAESKMDYTRITISKGENSQCIEINTATGRHVQN